MLPHVAEGLDLCAAGGHHGSTQKRWRGPARDPAQCGTPPTPISQPPLRQLPPTDAATRAAPARLQGTGARPAVPHRLWPHRLTFPPATPSALGPRIPSGDAATFPHLASDDRLSQSRIGDGRRPLLTPFCL